MTIEWLEPVDRYGRPADPWRKFTFPNAPDPRGRFGTRGPGIVLPGTRPEVRTRRYAPPTWSEIDACAERLGSFTLTDLRVSLACSQNAVYGWKKARHEYGMLERVAVGVYRLTGQVAA